MCLRACVCVPVFSCLILTCLTVLLHTRILISHGHIATDETATETRQRGGGGGGGRREGNKQKKQASVCRLGPRGLRCLPRALCGGRLQDGDRWKVFAASSPLAVDYKHGR